MSYEKFVAPVWWLVAAIALVILGTVNNVYVLSHLMPPHLNESYNALIRETIIKRILEDSVYVLFLLAEAIFYWRVRYKAINRALANAHAIGVFFVFSMVAYVVNRLHVLSNARSVAFWTFLIIAHVFFVILLIDYYKRKKTGTMSSEEQEEAPEVLNEYAEQ